MFLIEEKDKYYFQEKSFLGSQNSAQKMIDGVTMISDLVASVGSQPKNMISELAADKIAPPSWKSNLESRVSSNFRSITFKMI